MGLFPGHGGIDGAVERRLDQLFAPEAGVALAAVRVEDPERRPAARWACPAARYQDLRLLADDVPPEAEPRSTSQLEPDPGRLADGRRDIRDEARRLEDDEADPRPSGEGRKPTEAVGDAGGALEAGREVDDEEVDGPAGEQRAGHREALFGIDRGQDDEPLRPDAASDRLDRIEGGREIEPGHDRAGGLGLGDEPQGERRPPAREIAPERQAEPARQAARPEDRVEVGKPGREDSRRVRLWSVGNLKRECQPALRGPRRCPCEPSVRGCGRAPLRPEGRQGRRHVGRERRHPRIIEHLFE
jgi:hypothetical protein